MTAPGEGRQMVVISCGSSKLPTAAKARDLYTGSWFKAQLGYALSIADPGRVLILSALHGLIDLERMTEPYNVRMGQSSGVHERLSEQARTLLTNDVLCTAGIDYLFALRRVYPVRSLWTVIAPEMRGKTGMGHMISWLTKNHGRLV